MKITSLGIRSDIMFFKFINNADERPNYTVIRSPDNPSFFFGNVVIYPGKLIKGCFEKWTHDFKNEFQNTKGIEHVNVCWEEAGDIDEIKKFTDQGFEYSETLVIIAEKEKIKPVFLNHEVTCRPIVTDKEWEDVVEFKITTNTEFKEDAYRPFITKRFENYRKLSEQGHGHWYGAFYNNELVSDLGLFWEKDFARFQNITTLEKFRKRGISQTLINFAVQNSNRHFFVIEAEEDGPAIHMHKSIGFELKEKIYNLCYYDSAKWKP